MRCERVLTGQVVLNLLSNAVKFTGDGGSITIDASSIAAPASRRVFGNRSRMSWRIGRRVMYDLPSEENVGKCIITREVVLDKVNPTLVPRAKERTEREQKEMMALFQRQSTGEGRWVHTSLLESILHKAGAIGHVGQDEAIAGQGAGRQLAAEGATTVLCVLHEAGNIGLEQRCAGRETGEVDAEPFGEGGVDIGDAAVLVGIHFGERGAGGDARVRLRVHLALRLHRRRGRWQGDLRRGVGIDVGVHGRLATVLRECQRRGECDGNRNCNDGTLVHGGSCFVSCRWVRDRRMGNLPTGVVDGA